MNKEFLVLKTPLKGEAVALSEQLSVMVLEQVDSLYTHQRQSLCRRYQLRNGVFSRV